MIEKFKGDFQTLFVYKPVVGFCTEGPCDEIYTDDRAHDFVKKHQMLITNIIKIAACIPVIGAIIGFCHLHASFDSNLTENHRIDLQVLAIWEIVLSVLCIGSLKNMNDVLFKSESNDQPINIKIKSFNQTPPEQLKQKFSHILNKHGLDAVKKLLQPKEDEQLNIDTFNILFKEINTDEKLLQEFLSDQELIAQIIETYGMQSIEDILTNEHFELLPLKAQNYFLSKISQSQLEDLLKLYCDKKDVLIVIMSLLPEKEFSLFNLLFINLKNHDNLLTNYISILSLNSKNKLIDWLQPKLLLGNPSSLNKQIINSFSNEESDEELAAKVQAFRVKFEKLVTEFEAEIPREYIDQISQEIIQEAVKLPNSNDYIDLSTFNQLKRKNNTVFHPFHGKYYPENQFVLKPEFQQEINDWVEQYIASL